MARDTLDPVGVTFGTKTGQLWHSADEGVSWRRDHRRPARDLGGRVRGRRVTESRAMATVMLPRSLLGLVPGRRATARGRRRERRRGHRARSTTGRPGCAIASSRRGRACGAHINVFVDGRPGATSPRRSAATRHRPRHPRGVGRARPPPVGRRRVERREQRVERLGPLGDASPPIAARRRGRGLPSAGGSPTTARQPRSASRSSVARAARDHRVRMSPRRRRRASGRGTTAASSAAIRAAARAVRGRLGRLGSGIAA